jgi:3-oxoacyl-[acyl-carrier-protein] synthase II
MRQTGRSIPVTGLGCLCAAGGSVPELTDALFAGQRRVAWREVRGQRYPVFQLDNRSVPPGYYEGPECLRCGQLALAATREALLHAGLTPETLRDRTVGVCLGTTVGSAMNNEAFYRDFRANRRPGIEPIRQYLRANPASMVAQEFGLTGPCQTVTNACSSGAAAIGHAAGWVRTGICDVVLAGGADMLCSVIHAGFLSLLITDTSPCRPFDRNRRGLTLGEGAGIVVLESQQSVQERAGATGPQTHNSAFGSPTHASPVQAWLCGYGNASDAYHISTPEPNGTGLRRAIDQALAEADVDPREIDFINAHGTGTPENDRVEGRLFPEMFPGTPFGSTKGFTGHTLGAAGGIEAVITILCLQQRRIPANLGFEEPDPEFPGRPVAENTPVPGRYGLSDSVAFGGNNVALIFQESSQ